MTLTIAPTSKATMLIRQPIEQVFNAFVDPSATTKFWFDRASGRLVTGHNVIWYWDHYGVSVQVAVKSVDENRRINIEWPTPVEFLFTAVKAGTFVSILASGFPGNDDEQVAQALDSTEGFNLVMAGCKAYLEHGIQLNAVSDKDVRIGQVGA